MCSIENNLFAALALSVEIKSEECVKTCSKKTNVKLE